MPTINNIAELIPEKERVKMWRLAKVATGSDAAADDISQEVLINVWEHWNSLDRDSPIDGYLFAVTKQKISAYYRKRPRFLELDLNRYDKESEDDLLDEIMRRENKRELLEAINALPKKYQTIILLHYFEYMSFREIAEMMNLGYPSVFYRNKKALALLRDKLSDTIDGGPGGPGRRQKITLRTFLLLYGGWNYA